MHLKPVYKVISLVRHCNMTTVWYEHSIDHSKAPLSHPPHSQTKALERSIDASPTIAGTWRFVLT